MISAGFAEVGAEGEERQRALLALVRAHGARLLGPNCLGISSAAVRLDATFASRSAPAGNIGFSSQSGALGLALLEAAESRGLGLSAFVSIGNKADVSSNDLLEWWEDDPATEIVLLYLESFGNPRTFAKARPARRAAEADSRGQERDDCVRRSRGELAYGCACRLRGGGRRALPPGGRHTRDVARGAHRRGDAALGSADAEGSPGGRADECGRTRDPLRRRVRGGTGSSFPSSASDALARSQPMLPDEASLANPIDMLGSASDASYERVLPFLLADPGIDAVIALFVPTVSATADAVATAIARAAIAGAREKPVLAVVMSAEGIPASLRAEPRVTAALTYPESAARALGRAAERAEWLRRPLGTICRARGNRPRRCCRRGRACARLADETLARARGDAPAAPARVRHPARPGGNGSIRGRGASRPPRRSAIRSSSRRRGGRAQDRDRRHRARPARRRLRFVQP